MGEKRIARVFPRRTAATPDDDLAFVDCTPPMLILPELDEVHVSVAFTWDRERAEQLAYEWAILGVPVKVGGPAYGDRMGDFVAGRYIKQGYTITSRGCPNQCWFCEVGRVAKGHVQELQIQDGWNILDDNILATSRVHFDAVIEMLKRQPQRPIFTGGIEAKLLTDYHAARLRECRTKRLYCAYDTPDDLEPLIEAGNKLRNAGFTIKSHALCCYVLIGYRGDTFERAEKRLHQTIAAGFVPYAMLYRDDAGAVDVGWRRFQREWCRPQIVTTKLMQEGER